MILHIDVKNKIATYQQRDGFIVCGNSGYQIQWTFDSEWEGKPKKACFIWNGIPTKDIEIDENGLCNVPLIGSASSVKVGAYTADQTMATTGAVIGCQRSILCE